jgi:hypothetical protein
MADDQLTLQEQVLLLCLDDQTGKFESRWIDEGLSAAALGELLLLGRIGLDAVGLVQVLDPTPVGDDGVDPVLVRMAQSSASLSPGHWIHELRDSALLNAVLIPRLIRRGVLRKEGQRFLFIFNQTVYPTLSAAPEQALRQHVRFVLAGTDPADGAVAALIAILARMQETPEDPIGALRLLLTEPEQALYSERIEEIIGSTPTHAALARGVADAVRIARAEGGA